MRPWKGKKYTLNKKTKKAKCVWNSKFDIGKKKITLKRTCPGKCREIGKKKKKKASSIPQEQKVKEGRKERRQTRQEIVSYFLYNMIILSEREIQI